LKLDSRGRRLWSPEEEGQIIALWSEGNSQADIAAKLDSTAKAIDHKLRQLRDKKKVGFREAKKIPIKNKDLDELKTENIKLKRYVGICDKLKKIIPFKIHRDLSINKSESTAILQLADWHAEEEVNPYTINELNRYNLDIFSYRATQTSQRTLKLIEMFQKDTIIKKLVIQLGGDFITGNIHEENLENCQLRPTQAVYLAFQHIQSSIEFFLNNSKLDIVVVCNMGNHPRITKQVRYATEAGNSLEYLMYKVLEDKYKNDKRINFIVSEGYFTYINIYGLLFRFSHGHKVKYGGGIGGVLIPLKKAIGEWNKGKQADVDVLNHFHTSLFTHRIIINGSLIGYNAFALGNKFEYEQPQQNLFLTHKTKGLTIFSPIYYDK